MKTADVRLVGGQVLKQCPVIKESKYRYLIEYYEQRYDYYGRPLGRRFLVQKWHLKSRVMLNEF